MATLENTQPNFASKFKWLNDKEVIEFLQVYGLSEDDLKQPLVNGGVVSTVKGKPDYRVQVSLGPKRKVKLNSFQLWISLHIAFGDESQRDFLSFTREALGYEGSDCEKLSGFVEDQFEKLEKLDLKGLLSSGQRKLAEKGREALVLLEDSRPTQRHRRNVCHILPSDSDDDNTDETTVEKPKRHPILEILYQDVLCGIGLREDVVVQKYEEASEAEASLTLQERVSELLIDLKNHTSTVKQSCRIWNLFLLYSFTKWQCKWENEGMYLADHKNVYSFLKALQSKEISLTSFEPSFKDVAAGIEVYSTVPGTKSLSKGNGKKILTALGALQKHQMGILDQDVYVKIREHVDIQRWLSNSSTSEITRREGEFGDRQKSVVITESPLQLKERQSKEMLSLDSSIQHRNRAMSMAQLFSMSRFDELQRWRITDMHLFVYGSELPTMGCMDMNVVSVTMSTHKQLKNASLPDEKLLIRHLNYLLCPLFAIAFMFYDRYVINAEKPLNLLADPREWYDIKVFRSSKSSEKSLNNSTLYTQRRDMLQKTSSSVNGLVNHMDRKLGAICGKLVGLDTNQLRSVGLWDSSTLARHYDKIPEPAIPAKLAGFAGSGQFYIHRERATIEHFCRENEGSEDFFKCFFPFLEDKEVEQGVLHLQQCGNNTPSHVFRTLRYLKAVFFRDIVFLRDSYPGLYVFSSPPFVQFSEVFEKWCEFVKKYETSCDDVEADNEQACTNDEWKDKLEEKTAQVAAQCSSNARKLDRIMSLLEQRSKPTETEEPKDTAHEVFISKQGLPMLTHLRPFKDMSLREVFQEYMYGFDVSGIHYPALKSLEARRVNEGEKYRHTSLRTIIGKRMVISQYLEEQAALLGDLEDSFKAAEELQRKIGKKRPCSLHQFWLHIKKKQKRE